MARTGFETDYLLKTDCDAARKRHRDFWQNKPVEGPLLHIRARRPAAVPQLDIDPAMSRKDRELCPNWHINHCRKQVLAYDHLYDSMPIAQVMFGRDITNMGVLSGHQFMIHDDTEFIAFAKKPRFLFEPTPRFDQDSPFVKKALAIYRAVMADMGRKACVNPPTTADALSTMAMVMGMEDFLRGLIKYPAQIRKKALELNSLFYKFYDHIYSRLLAAGYGESASWFPVFAEGKFDSVRSDVSVMLSEKMFIALSLLALADACSYLDYSIFNLDSVRLIRFLEPLSTVRRLNGIYWNIEPWLGDLGRYLSVMKKIREMDLLLVLPCKSVNGAKLAINKLGKSGLCLELPPFPDRARATAAGDALIKYAAGCLY